MSPNTPDDERIVSQLPRRTFLAGLSALVLGGATAAPAAAKGVTIDRLDVLEKGVSSPRRVTVKWAAESEAGLRSAVISLLGPAGRELDSETVALSGSTASGK